jgi:hypothetical protein
MSYTDLAQGQIGRYNGMGVAPVHHGNDSSLFVEFFVKMEKREFESEKAGRDICQDVEYIRIIMGQKSSIERPARLKKDGPTDARPTDPERFPRQYEAFKAGMEQVQTGSPLEMWPPMSNRPAMLHELKAMRIHTVEQFAALPDTLATNAPLGWRDMRDKAQLWLREAEGHAVTAELEAKNANLEHEINALKAQMAELSAARQKERA